MKSKLIQIIATCKESANEFPNFGGTVKIIAAIEDPEVITKILAHLGLPTRAPPRALDLFETA